MYNGVKAMIEAEKKYAAEDGAQAKPEPAQAQAAE